MIDFADDEIAVCELRNAAYHEAGHKALYERFGGAGDVVVWKNESSNSDERERGSPVPVGSCSRMTYVRFRA